MSGEELHKVRTTINPDRELEVTGAERLDLERQGLLVGGKTKVEQRRNARQLQDGGE